MEKFNIAKSTENSGGFKGKSYGFYIQGNELYFKNVDVDWCFNVDGKVYELNHYELLNIIKNHKDPINAIPQKNKNP